MCNSTMHHYTATQRAYDRGMVCDNNRQPRVGGLLSHRPLRPGDKVVYTNGRGVDVEARVIGTKDQPFKDELERNEVDLVFLRAEGTEPVVRLAVPWFESVVSEHGETEPGTFKLP